MKSENESTHRLCFWTVIVIPVLMMTLALPVLGQTTPLGDGPYAKSAVLVLTPQNAIGPVNQVDPATLTCSDVINFESLAVGTTYDGVIVETGASFAERFVGQSIAFVGDFDVLGPVAGSPLSLQTGLAGENLHIHGIGGGNTLTGCGPVGCPAFQGIGEGSVGALFDVPQSEFGFTVLGIDGGGSMIVDFFAADGANIDTLNIPLLSGNLTVGFQRAGGVTDIAGFSVFNDDPAGVAYDDIVFCNTIEVAIDIKFCSDPNAFNCKKKGVLPVTIFGTTPTGIYDIDPSTLRLCRADTGICTNGPKDWSYADRGNPISDLGAAMCAIDPATGQELDYLNPDDFDDMDAAFEASEVQDMLSDFCDRDKGAVSEALIILGSTLDGTPIYSVPFPNVGTDQLWKVNK